MKSEALKNTPAEVRLNIFQKLIKKFTDALESGPGSKPATTRSQILRQRIAQRIASCLVEKKKLDVHDDSFSGTHTKIKELPGCKL